VDRPGSDVYARDEYCSAKHSSSDPLNGTKIGQQLEREIDSERDGKIELSLQTSFFHADASMSRVDIALAIPWNSLKREWIGKNLNAAIGVLGKVYREDGTLALRFSDLACCSLDDAAHMPVFFWGHPPLGYGNIVGADKDVLPARYETQFDLSPGHYQLQIVLSDGSKFGRLRLPLIVNSYDEGNLAISSLALCKRFHRPQDGPRQEDTIVELAPDLIPFLSKGLQFTPAGDTRFEKGEPLFAYFEVYGPSLAEMSNTKVQTRLRVTNAQNGELKVDTGFRDAASWMQPGNSAIHIGEQIAVDKLPKGSYRLEVRATDSAGGSTPWRAATFTVE
jgi:hypothetical protein